MKPTSLVQGDSVKGPGMFQSNPRPYLVWDLWFDLTTVGPEQQPSNLKDLAMKEDHEDGPEET